MVVLDVFHFSEPRGEGKIHYIARKNVLFYDNKHHCKFIDNNNLLEGSLVRFSGHEIKRRHWHILFYLQLRFSYEVMVYECDSL